MRRLFHSLLLALGLILGASLTSEISEADHQVTFFVDGYGELDQYNPAIRELRDHGVFRWRYVQEPGGVNAIDDVLAALDRFSARYGVLMVHDPINGYNLVSTGGSNFIYGNGLHGACGSWAIGCITEFPHKPATVLDTGTMAGWPQASRLEVWYHELLHTLSNLAEGYMEGYIYGTTSCAPINDGGVVAGIHRSLMNCGLFNAQVLDAYTDFAWGYSHNPCRPDDCFIAKGVNEGGEYVFWKNTAKTRSVSFFACTPGVGANGERICTSYRWLNYHLSPQGTYQGWHLSNLPLQPGEVACINLENGVSSRYGRNDRCLT